MNPEGTSKLLSVILIERSRQVWLVDSQNIFFITPITGGSIPLCILYTYLLRKFRVYKFLYKTFLHFSSILFDFSYFDFNFFFSFFQFTFCFSFFEYFWKFYLFFFRFGQVMDEFSFHRLREAVNTGIKFSLLNLVK